MSNTKEESKEDKKRRKQEKKEKKKRKRDSVEQHTTPHKNKVSRQDDDKQSSIANAHSPFQKKSVNIMMSLLPSAMGNVQKAIHTSMQSMLLKYSDSLGGVLLSYDSIKIDERKNDGRYGKVLNEMPHMHFFTTCNVLVFNPSIGKSLTGVVNETFPSHVGVLVHELFNAMISAESLRDSGFTFDADLNEWSKDDTMVPVAIGDSIKFTVDKMHECNGLISLECKEPIIV
jgi:DNA-directed RNA polymerase subunit E'/Rpb7